MVDQIPYSNLTFLVVHDAFYGEKRNISRSYVSIWSLSTHIRKQHALLQANSMPYPLPACSNCSLSKAEWVVLTYSSSLAAKFKSAIYCTGHSNKDGHIHTQTILMYRNVVSKDSQHRKAITASVSNSWAIPPSQGPQSRWPYCHWCLRWSTWQLL